MVDVGGKADNERISVARDSVYMSPETLEKIKPGGIDQGDVLSLVQTVGIMVGQTQPASFPCAILETEMDFVVDVKNAVHIEAMARTTRKTGIETAALTVVSVAALTIYDVCKNMDRSMRITDIRLVRKDGGKSGLCEREQVYKPFIN